MNQGKSIFNNFSLTQTFQTHSVDVLCLCIDEVTFKIINTMQSLKN